MYSTCLFCHASLGANEVIEHFPVGRRLAFDATRGRLWAVCGVCRQWNLTPLEERWEAIEEAERGQAHTIVLGSHGKHGLAKALLGSVADEGRKATDLPVLLVTGDGVAPSDTRPQRPAEGRRGSRREAATVDTLDESA